MTFVLSVKVLFRYALWDERRQRQPWRPRLWPSLTTCVPQQCGHGGLSVDDFLAMVVLSSPLPARYFPQTQYHRG